MIITYKIDFHITISTRNNCHITWTFIGFNLGRDVLLFSEIEKKIRKANNNFPNNYDDIDVYFAETSEYANCIKVKDYFIEYSIKKLKN